LNYLRLEWGPDFQQNEVGLIGSDDVPLLTTSLLNWPISNSRAKWLYMAADTLGEG
jgi:hypothetical protein